MKLDKSSDTSDLTHVASISDEIIPVFEELEKGYRKCNIEMFFVFRCLPEQYGGKSRARYSKVDNTIYFDVVVSEEKYCELSKNWQRYELSHFFYSFFSDALRKYKIAGLDVDGFLDDFKKGLHEIGWLKDESDVFVDEF